MSMPSLPSGGNERGWLSNPENKTTAIFLIVAGIGCFMLWGMILPFILAVLGGTIEAMWHAAIIVGVVMALTSKRVHMMARVINRWITGWFVSLDPIGIREDQIEQTEKRKEESDGAVGVVRGLRSGLGKRLDYNCEEYKQCMLRLKAAKSVLSDPGESPERKYQAQRSMLKDAPYSDELQKIITAQQAQIKHYDNGLLQLTRFGELCDDFIERRRREIRLEKDNKTEAGAMRTVRLAMGAIFGKVGDVGAQMDAMAKDKLDREYEDEIGKYDQFVTVMSGSVATADFNNLAALQDVQSKLDRFDALRGATPQIAAPANAMQIPAAKETIAVSEYFR